MSTNSEKLRAKARRFHPRRIARKVSGREAMAEIGNLTTRVNGVAERSQASVQLSARTSKSAELASREVNRLGPQLAALESKVEELRLALEPIAEPGSGELSEARSLVETIQEEHRRIRVRLSAVTQYEERLRRIEEQLGLPHD